nr:MAG TPA: PaaX-like protein [Siphoviridae sp. ct8IY7]
MRFSTTLNNQKCMEWELNATQGVLIALLYEANAWANEEIVDDKTYYFVSRNLILKELPMFFEKADTVYRNLKVLAEKGIIEYIKHKGMDLIRLTEKGKSWNFIESNSEKSPNFDNNSEKNPSEFGKKSENNSEKNPTYKDTNIQKDISKNNKEKNKKEKSKNEIHEFINNLTEDNEYKELLFKYIEYRKDIKKPIKTVLPIKKIVKDFPNWFALDEAINIAMEKEWTGLEPEWIEKHKKSKAFNTNTENKIAESKDTSHLKVDDDYMEQMKARYGL